MEDEIVQYVERRLQIWADWYIRAGDSGLGYPRQSLESRALECGGILVRSYGPKYLPSNDSAEEIELLVCELAKQNYKLAQALREYYFGQGTIKQRAKAVNISCTQFKVLVDMAKQWLIGRVTAFLRK